MKKIIMITMLLSLTAVSVFAERMVLIQATYLHTSRTYEGIADYKRSYGEVGLNFTSFSGKDFGFYSSASFVFPVAYTQEKNGTDMGSNIDTLDATYDQMKLGLDLLLGVGFLAPITPMFSLLVAGGLHFNGIALLSGLHNVDPYLAYNLGPGVAINALFNLTKSFNINISAMAAWDVFEFITLPEDSYNGFDAKGGITWAMSAGLGFAY